MTDKPISRQANIVVQGLENELLIYDLSINKACCLNQTAALVYQLCDGKRTIAEISELMSKELKTLVSEDFVWLAIDGLKKDGLLENADKLADHFGRLTRREIVKRVGLASMVMLPLIASVVAPSAAMAASGATVLFASCTSPSDCGPSAPFCRSLIDGTPLGNSCCVGNIALGGTGTVVMSSNYPSCSDCYTTSALFCCSGTGTNGSCTPSVLVPGTFNCTFICS